MTFIPLAQDDQRLRLVCTQLTKAQLRLKAQQQEIDGLLDYVAGHGNKGVGKAHDKAVQSVVGLSANQVGVMKQICVVDLSIGRKGYHDLHVLVNPRIIWRSKVTVSKNEGCVNFAMVRGTTVRSNIVRVQALDRSGNEVTYKLNGWTAVLLQHETDHLNGRLFIDRLSDPSQADFVDAAMYQDYRKNRLDWPHKIDVSMFVKNS
jgi:peptide deformylase